MQESAILFRHLSLPICTSRSSSPSLGLPSWETQLKGGKILFTKPLAVASIALIAANCANVGNFGNLGNFCEERPYLCVLVGVTIVAGAVWIIADDGDSNPGSDTSSDSVSDERLKREIREVETLPNGLKLYAFRYWNDDRTFVSVMAQDVLKDSRYAHAVSVDESGYYKVDLNAVGVRIAGDVEAFEEASANALEGL